MLNKTLKIKFNRRYGTTGSTDTTIIENSVKNGAKVSTITQITKTWTELSKTKKIGLGVYALCAAFGFMFATYNDGRDELIKRRDCRDVYPKIKDWDGVKYACTSNIFTNLFESIVFPFTFASNIMPKIVIWLNPENQ